MVVGSPVTTARSAEEPKTSRMDDDYHHNVRPCHTSRHSGVSPSSSSSSPQEEGRPRQDSAASSDGSSIAAQTRFSFYNAEEVAIVLQQQEKKVHNDSGSSDDHQEREVTVYNTKDITSLSSKNPHRFEFYDPNDEQVGGLTNHNNNTAAALDGQDILRSLQEQEQQHLLQRRKMANSNQVAGPNDEQVARTSATQPPKEDNPYEDAIKEALNLLWKHRTPEPDQTNSLPTMTSSHNSSSSPPVAVATAPGAIDLARSSPEPQQPQHLDEVASSLTSSSSAKDEAAVQKGVERVLLAILERASSNSRGAQSSSSSSGTSSRQRRRQQQEQIQTEDTAVEVISPPRSMDATEEDILTKVVVDLLESTQPDSNLLQSEEPYHTTQNELQDDDEDVFEEIEESSFDDEGGQDEDAHNNTVDTLEGVLGPLSKKAGGTTGVVLELQDSPETAQKESVMTPTSLLDSLSTAIKDAESMISSYISPGRDGIQQEDQPMQHSKRSNDHGDKVCKALPIANKSHHDDEEEEDDEAVELMRTLCAHFLPFGVDQSSRLLDQIPEWDESNPNEPGYRIIRLTKHQLRRIERAFEGMVDTVKMNSERRLNHRIGIGEDISNDTTDDSFERDLETAEELLDRSERRKEAKLGSYSQSHDGDDDSNCSGSSGSSSASGSSVGSAESPGSSPPPSPQVSLQLREFPGVRQAGQGEMGDLEFFHLPIIFKSHVTGFEPTKDLFLEPGNVVAGQYLVESELGSAAFSTAYRCVDLSSGTTEDDHDEVCLKVIKNTKDFFDQSLDEIKILELLRQTGKCHENHIVEMRTFFYHREHLIIVTELLRQNLFEFGKFILDNDEEPYFTLRRLAYITRQVLIALKFVHSLGLVHSDVKPENILLGSYSRAQVKLIDFGSSCYLTDRQSSYIQSRSYRAPEVVLGLPYDGKIDIWSLGCVVAEMYTGEVTFQNDSIVSMLSRIEAICGPFPRHMIAQGRQSGRFFTKSGLLYESVDGDESEKKSLELDDEDSASDNEFFDIFQPKVTSLAARLGIDVSSHSKSSRRDREEAMFVDFVQKLLTIDPDGRPTARKALEHPWMVMASHLTDKDIKYPS